MVLVAENIGLIAKVNRKLVCGVTKIKSGAVCRFLLFQWLGMAFENIALPSILCLVMDWFIRRSYTLTLWSRFKMVRMRFYQGHVIRIRTRQ